MKQLVYARLDFVELKGPNIQVHNQTDSIIIEYKIK